MQDPCLSFHAPLTSYLQPRLSPTQVSELHSEQLREKPSHLLMLQRKNSLASSLRNIDATTCSLYSMLAISNLDNSVSIISFHPVQPVLGLLLFFLSPDPMICIIPQRLKSEQQIQVKARSVAMWTPESPRPLSWARQGGMPVISRAGTLCGDVSASCLNEFNSRDGQSGPSR